MPDIAIKLSRVTSAKTYQEVYLAVKGFNTHSLTMVCSRLKLGALGTIKEKEDKIYRHWITTNKETGRRATPEDVFIRLFPGQPHHDTIRQQVVDLTSEVSPPVAPAPLTIQLPAQLPRQIHAPRSPRSPPPVREQISNLVVPANYTEPASRIVPLSTVVRLKTEEDNVMAAIKDAHENRIKGIGLTAYMAIRFAHATLDFGPMSGYQLRLNAFISKKTEILDGIRTQTEGSQIDYINAMTEYNKMIDMYPLFVSVPARETHTPPVAVAVARQANVPPPTPAVTRQVNVPPVAVAVARQVNVPPVAAAVTRQVNVPPVAVAVARQVNVPPVAAAVTRQVNVLPSSVVAEAVAAANRYAQRPQNTAAVTRQVNNPPSQANQYSVANGKNHLLRLRITTSVEKSLNKKSGNSESDNECSICTETFTNHRAPKTRLNCNHEICGQCVITIARNRTKNTICCPFCRETIVSCALGTKTIKDSLTSAIARY